MNTPSFFKKIKKRYQYKNIVYVIVALIVFLAPASAFAAICSVNSFAVKGIGAYLLYPACFINKLLVPLAFALEILFFFVGVAKYIANADNDAERAKGSKYILRSVIVIAITASIAGILAFMIRSLGWGVSN